MFDIDEPSINAPFPMYTANKNATIKNKPQLHSCDGPEYIRSMHVELENASLFTHCSVWKHGHGSNIGRIYDLDKLIASTCLIICAPSFSVVL